MLDAFGYFDNPAPHRFAKRYDPCPGAAHIDLGDIGEDSLGIWIKRHPEVLLVQSQGLVEVYAAFRNCGSRDLGPSDIRSMSAFEVSAWSVLQNALMRKESAKHASRS